MCDVSHSYSDAPGVMISPSHVETAPYGHQECKRKAMPKTIDSCSECGPLSCYRKDKTPPTFCLTEAADPQEVAAIVEHLRGDNLDGRMARAAAEIEGIYYCNATRAEEIVLFARRIGAKRIGVATCRGLIQEARTFAKVLRAKGLEAFTVACKIGSVDKTEIGVSEDVKIEKGSYEAMCNPILQAKTLNAQKSDLNVLVGLCVGHDSLFIKYSEAPSNDAGDKGSRAGAQSGGGPL